MENQNIRIHLKAYDNKILDLSTEEIVKQFFPHVKMSRKMDKYEAILSSKKIRDILGFNPTHDWKNYFKGDLL